MSEGLSEAGLGRLKALRDAASETHKTAGDTSAHVERKDELQPREEWRFRQALRENADSLIELAERGLDIRAMALALRALAQVEVRNASRDYMIAAGTANMVLRAYEYKRQAREATAVENPATEIEPTI